MIEPSAKIRSAVLDLLAAQDAAWAAGDAHGFSEGTVDEVVFTNIVGMFSVGRVPFQAQHQAIFQTIYKGSALRQSLVHLTLVRDDVAIVDTLCELTGFAHLPPGVAAADGVLKTRLEQVLVLEDSRWRVAAFHNVPVRTDVAAPT